jgi:AcrR family transcriptional regulator
VGKPAEKREIKQERAARTRMEILQAGIELFARRGILATTMNELARAIKMTPGALYWHFPTKEDLLLAAIEEVHRRYVGEFTEILTEGRKWPAKKQLVAFLERTRAFLRYHPVHGIFYGMLVAESANNNPRVADAIREALKLYGMVLAGIVRYGQKKGELRDDINPESFANAVMATHMGMICHQQLFNDMTYDSMCDAVDIPLLEGIDKPQRHLKG